MAQISPNDIAYSADLLAVERAKPDDAEFLEEAAMRVSIDNYSHFARGFLFYPLTSDEYRERLEAGDVGYIFNYDGRPFGFLLGVNEWRCEQCDSRTVSYRLAAMVRDEVKLNKFLLIEQLAILPEFQDKGVCGELVRRVSEICRVDIAFQMLESPLRHPCIPFWCRNGFNKVLELVERPSERFLRLETGESSSEKLIWGLYLKRALSS